MLSWLRLSWPENSSSPFQHNRSVQSACVFKTFYRQLTLLQDAALQPCNTLTVHRERNAQQHVQSGQKCTIESSRQFAAPAIWNNTDGATEQRETGTTGQLQWGSFFLLGDERQSWISYRACEVLVLSGITRSRRTKVHRRQSLAPARLAAENTWSKLLREAVRMWCRSSVIKLLNLRRKVALLPSSGEGWRSSNYSQAEYEGVN